MAHIILFVLATVTPRRVEPAERDACEAVESRRNPAADHDDAVCQ